MKENFSKFTYFESYDQICSSLPSPYNLAMYQAINAYGLRSEEPDFSAFGDFAAFMGAAFGAVRANIDRTHNLQRGGAPDGNQNARGRGRRQREAAEAQGSERPAPSKSPAGSTPPTPPPQPPTAPQPPTYPFEDEAIPFDDHPDGKPPTLDEMKAYAEANGLRPFVAEIVAASNNYMGWKEGGSSWAFDWQKVIGGKVPPDLNFIRDYADKYLLFCGCQNATALCEADTKSQVFFERNKAADWSILKNSTWTQEWELRLNKLIEMTNGATPLPEAPKGGYIPTYQEVEAFAQQLGCPEKADPFLDFMRGNNGMLNGKEEIKNWRGLFRKWEPPR